MGTVGEMAPPFLDVERRANTGEPSKEELVTVVIPVRNEEAEIDTCLDSIRQQSYRNLQIIVADGRSTDRTRGLVRRHMAEDPRIELLENEGRIVPTGLNRALAATRARWLVRVDGHATVPPDYVHRAVEHLRTGRWAGVGGVKAGHGRTPAGHAIAAAMSSRFGVGGSTYHYGTTQRLVGHVPFGAYSVDVARALGGWDERLVVNQDFEFDYRLRQSGGQLLFDPQMRIRWQCRQSVPDLFRQYRRYGRGKVAVMKLHPRSISPRHLVPPALVLSWAVAGVLSLRSPRIAAALVSPYAVALAAGSVTTSRRLESSAQRRWVAPAFIAMHAGWGLGFYEGLLRHVGRRR